MQAFSKMLKSHILQIYTQTLLKIKSLLQHITFICLFAQIEVLAALRRRESAGSEGRAQA